MQSNIEIEAKILLSEKDFYTVVKYLHLERYKKNKQINHYIDTSDRLLKANDIALRVRETDEFVLTLKTPLSEGLLEKNQVLTWRSYSELEDEGVFPSGDIKDFLEICGFNVRNLKILANLTTYRIELEYDDGIICLDENVYGTNNEFKDYELEVECNSIQGAENLAKKLLDEAGIKDYKFNTHSKQARAINAVK